MRYELASGAVRDLPASETATAPQHKPNDTTVLYLDRDGLALTQNAGDATPQRLLGVPPLLGPAAYSPDGQFVLYGRARPAATGISGAGGRTAARRQP